MTQLIPSPGTALSQEMLPRTNFVLLPGTVHKLWQVMKEFKVLAFFPTGTALKNHPSVSAPLESIKASTEFVLYFNFSAQFYVPHPTRSIVVLQSIPKYTDWIHVSVLEIVSLEPDLWHSFLFLLPKSTFMSQHR